MFKVYLQMFAAVECGFLVSRGRRPICKRFHPKSHKACSYLWSQPLPLSVPGSSSKLAGRGGTKTLSLTYPHTEKSRGVKSDDLGGQANVPPRPIQATVCHVTRENHVENLRISVHKI